MDFLDILLALQMEIMSNNDKHQNPKQVLGVINPVTVTPRLSCWLFNVSSCFSPSTFLYFASIIQDITERQVRYLEPLIQSKKVWLQSP